MTLKIIDVPDVLSAVKAVVDEAGHEYQHEGECLYTNVLGEPTCLVGRAAEKLDLPLPAFSSHHNHTRVRALAAVSEWPITDEALNLLVDAQERQDGPIGDAPGEQWGDILLALIDRTFLPAGVA